MMDNSRSRKEQLNALQPLQSIRTFSAKYFDYFLHGQNI